MRNISRINFDRDFVEKPPKPKKVLRLVQTGPDGTSVSRTCFGIHSSDRVRWLRLNRRFCGLTHLVMRRSTRSRRGGLKVTGGAGIGASASILDISIASLFHTTRAQSLPSTLNTRYQDKLVRYRSVFSNFHPIIMSPTGTHHHHHHITSHHITITLLPFSSPFRLAVST